MSQCHFCGDDDIYGKRFGRDKRSSTGRHLGPLWLCRDCGREPHGPVVYSTVHRIPVAGAISLGLIISSVILAIGAHW